VVREVESYKSTVFNENEYYKWIKNQQKNLHFIRYPIFWSIITSRCGYLSIKIDQLLTFIDTSSTNEQQYTPEVIKLHKETKNKIRRDLQFSGLKMIFPRPRYVLNNLSLATSAITDLGLVSLIASNDALKNHFVTNKLMNSIIISSYEGIKPTSKIYKEYYQIDDRIDCFEHKKSIKDCFKIIYRKMSFENHRGHGLSNASADIEEFETYLIKFHKLTIFQLFFENRVFCNVNKYISRFEKYNSPPKLEQITENKSNRRVGSKRKLTQKTESCNKKQKTTGIETFLDLSSFNVMFPFELELFFDRRDSAKIEARETLSSIMDIIRSLSATKLNSDRNTLMQMYGKIEITFIKVIILSLIDCIENFLSKSDAENFQFNLSLICMALDDDIEIADIMIDKGINLKNSIFFKK
jgi:hypothetical protein